MTVYPRVKKIILWGVVISACLGFLTVASLALYFNPRLPDVESLKNIQLQTPLRIYSADNKLIAEFGEKRRTPIAIDDVPKLFIDAILAAEDDGFERHHGVDIKSLIRAAFELVTTGHIRTGGSTITMQVARNYFLSFDQTFSRKFNEILLALQIEQELSKPEILELYVNKIYLGNRAYGIQSAAQVYYGKNIQDLDVAQLAMIAGLPKAPSAYNPIANPDRALVRRNWILGRMLKLGYIDQSQHDFASDEPVSASYYGLRPELEAPYIAEMVRAELLESYPADMVYTAGIRVITTINSKLQESANLAVQEGLLAYDRRHGYRGPEASFPLPEAITPTVAVDQQASDQQDDPEIELAEAPAMTEQDTGANNERHAAAVAHLKGTQRIGPLVPAIVLSIDDQSFSAVMAQGERVTLHWNEIKWARPYLSTNAMGPRPKLASDIVSAGDLVRLRRIKNKWALAQVPIAQSALVSLNPEDGALQALVGGFNFHHSKFNRATQAARQPGSNFKPFIYTAALANGYTTASMINDAPVVFDDDQLESAWRPENYSGKFYGPTRLRKALYQSRNLVSIRLLRALGIGTAINYVERFGFNRKQLPRDLSLALGSAEFTPLEIVTGYASFANGGYKVEPYLIDRIENVEGITLLQHIPYTVCPECLSDEPPAKATATEEVELQNIREQALDDALLAELGDDGATDDSAAQAEDAPAAEQLAEIEVPRIPHKVLPAQRIIEPRIAYIINSVLRDVVKLGTGRRALSLGRSDLAGKTGTTNDQKDAWFSGYNHALVATAWVGFDQPATLGKREVGGYAALPIWIDFMRDALANKKETNLEQPRGLVSVRIDPTTGKRARPGQSNAVFELFRVENVPREEVNASDVPSLYGQESTIPEQLF